jgi:tetratricopeptide (TPR) repeat protein
MGRSCVALIAVALMAPLALSAIALPAQAQSDEARERARVSYARGQELFRAGQFEQAERAFREAYEAVPNPVVLLGISETLERRNRGAESVTVLEQYLAERVNAPDRTEVEARIARIRARPARLVITSVPAGAAIRINGEERAEVTPAELEVPPEQYTVTLQLDGYADATEAVEAQFATNHKIELTLTEPVEEPEEALGVGEGDEYEPEPPPVVEAERSVSAGVWVMTAIGGAALVAGTVLGFLALSEQAEFDEMPSEDTATRGERFALFADVSFGLALAAGITAVVLYLTDSASDAEDAAVVGEEQVRWSPVVTAQGGGIDAQVRF